MTVAPIYDAVRLTRFLIVPALDALTTAGVYWWVAPQTATRPFVVVFSQDQGGVSVLRLGSQGWSGLITVKAVADTLSAAEALLAQVAPAMDTLTAPTNYDLSVQYTRPLALPPDAQGIHQVGGIWDVRLERVTGVIPLIPGRTLTFSDDFSGSALDPAKWVAVPPGNGNGANGYEAAELQANIASTITEGGGNLTVTAQKVNPPGPQVGGKNYTSGCPSTYGLFSFSYGRFELRATVPHGGGQWPAFWLYPADATLDQSTVLVPEIDIFEFFNGSQNISLNYFDAQHLGYQQVSNLGDLSLAFHTYALEWSVNKLEWFVDNVSVFSTPYQVASQRMYVIMQFSLGGTGGVINDAALPATFVMDYVRVYETLDVFHPGQIGGLQLWYDAERLRSLTTYYASGATDLVNNASLDRWYDRAGWGNDRSPLHGTVGNQPIFKTSQVNGLSAVHFDGTNDFLNRSAVTIPMHIGTGSFAFGAVVRCDNVSGAGVYKCIFDYGQNGINSPGFYIQNGKPLVSTGNADFLFATTLSSSTWYFLYWQRDGSNNNLNCWVNGVQDANTLTFNRNVPDLAYEIGNDHTTDWFNGDIAEIIFYNTLPTAAERTKLFTYYSTKYAIF